MNDAVSMLQAVCEGVIFSSAHHVQRLLARRRPFDKARLSGAVSKVAAWAQMMADTLRIPLEVLNIKEHGARGAAICAGICAGLWRDFTDAATRLEDEVIVYTPDRARAPANAEKPRAYINAVAALDAFHKAL